MTEEIWKPITVIRKIDYRGHYEISNLGRVRSFKFGPHQKRRDEPRILKPSINQRGHAQIRLGGWSTVAQHNSLYTHSVAHLVAREFVGPRGLSYGVVHKNGDVSDNRAANLKWQDVEGTRGERRMLRETLKSAAVQRVGPVPDASGSVVPTSQTPHGDAPDWSVVPWDDTE